MQRRCRCCCRCRCCRCRIRDIVAVAVAIAEFVVVFVIIVAVVLFRRLASFFVAVSCAKIDFYALSAHTRAYELLFIKYIL